MGQAGDVPDKHLIGAEAVTVRAVSWGQRHPAAVRLEEINDGWHAAMVGRGSDEHPSTPSWSRGLNWGIDIGR